MHRLSEVTPLMPAAAHGHGHVAYLLLEAGADPRVGSGNGHTAAELAQHHGHQDLAEWLTAAAQGKEDRKPDRSEC